MKLLIPCLLAAALASAQSTAQLEIRGTVVEEALGIGGVTVTLYEFGHTPAEATTRTVFAVTFTDATGKFTLHPTRTGEYYVEVKKEGYFAESYDGPTVDPVDSTGDPVSIDADHPLQERKFSLMRLGELHGRIVDEDGAPLANLRVGIRPGTITPVITDQDGYFTATKLRPGDYQVSVRGRSPEILPQFSEEDLKVVDQDLQVSNWPGVPVPVRSGASLSVGTITARKTPYYRAHLSVQSDDCAPGEKWTFSTTPEMAGIGPQIPCGKEFLVRNLAPGTYTFTLMTGGRPGDKRQWAVAPVEVTDKNLEIALTMSPGSDMSGTILVAEGAALPPYEKIRIDVTPIAASVLGRQLIAPNPAGKFLVRGMPGDRSRISVSGLPGKFYVREIRYNGQTVPDGIITALSGAPGLLDIVIDDQAATISGSVAGVDRPGARIRVAALKWPLPPEAASLAMLLGANASAWVDDQGHFQIGGLAPGEYRLLALTDEFLIQLTPDTLVQVLTRAEKVTLERGGSQSISLKIVEP
jgi:hypothetical protein